MKTYSCLRRRRAGTSKRPAEETQLAEWMDLGDKGQVWGAQESWCEAVTLGTKKTVFM